MRKNFQKPDLDNSSPKQKSLYGRRELWWGSLFHLVNKEFGIDLDNIKHLYKPKSVLVATSHYQPGCMCKHLLLQVVFVSEVQQKWVLKCWK